MTPMPRRHDIDALRILAFALVMLYHVGMYYVAGWHWHLKSPQAQEWLQIPMRALNLWRMDLVFLVSGLALGLLQRSRSGAQGLLGSRSRRLLLPLAFGMAVVVPYQAYAQAVANGSVAPGLADFLARYFTGGPWPRGAFDGAEFGVTWNHLWTLPYLWVYTALVVLAVPWLRSPPAQRLQARFLALRGGRLAWPVAPLMAASLLLWPHFPPTHDLIADAWLHAVYFTVFLYGWWMGTDAGWWDELKRLRAPLLAAALLMMALHFGLRAAALEAPQPALRMATRLAADAAKWAMLLAILGWACHALNRPWRWLPWANEQVFPWYVLHQTVTIALIVALAPLGLPLGWEAMLLLAGTVAGCWSVTAVVRRIGVLRPLFGLKRATSLASARPRCPSPATPAHPAAHSGE